MFEAYRIVYNSVFADMDTPHHDGNEYILQPYREGDEDNNDPSFLCTTWTLYGVKVDDNGTRSEETVGERSSEEAAHQLLSMILGHAADPGGDGLYYPRLVQTTASETLFHMTSLLAVDLVLQNFPEDRLPEERSRPAMLIAWTNEFHASHLIRKSDDEYLAALTDFYAEKSAQFVTVDEVIAILRSASSENETPA